MIFDVGDEVPDFNLDSQNGPIHFRDMIDGKWCLFVTFGSSFDPVSTTEIGMLSKLADEFEARNICVLICGNDSVSNYRKWIKDVEELQSVKVILPLLSDGDCSVLRQFGVARPSPTSPEVRVVSSGSFLIDIDKRIRSSFRYSPSAGRNFYEMLRLFDALQLVTYHQVVTPANWGSGQEVLIHPNVTADEAAATFRFAEIKPWFRLTPAPES